MTNPTDRQLEVLRVIHESIRERGYPPTRVEIAVAMGIASTKGVTDHLCALEQKGLITRAYDRSRAITITSAGYAAMGITTEEERVVLQLRKVLAAIHGPSRSHSQWLLDAFQVETRRAEQAA